MSTQAVEHEEGFRLSSVSSNTELTEIVLASPSVASLLPNVMRAMADEIERASRPGEISPSTAMPSHPPDHEELHSVAHHVAISLSATLTHRLLRNLSAGISEQALGALQAESIQSGEKAEEAAHSPDSYHLTRRRLRLKLLGSPEIILDGVRLKALERCNRAALIIYILALHPRGLSGERLAAYMTSDSAYADAFDADARMALGAVRTFIWRLRKLAGWPGVVVSPSEQGGYQSRYRLPDDTACDLWEFEAKLDEATRLTVRAKIEPEAADRAAALRQDAILLYTGEFCKGIGAGVVSEAAEYLRNRYLQAVMMQASYWKDNATVLQLARQKSGGRSKPSVQEERAWLEALSNYRLVTRVEPYDEAAYAGAMLCQAHLGQSKGVQKTLSRCSQVLHAEMDTKPQPTTMRTARECLQIASRVSSTARC